MSERTPKRGCHCCEQVLPVVTGICNGLTEGVTVLVRAYDDERGRMATDTYCMDCYCLYSFGVDTAQIVAQAPPRSVQK